MFMGYGLQDLNFKVIFQSLVIAMEPGLRKESVSLQLCKTEINERMYLAKSLENKNIEVIWGDLDQFVAGIRARFGPKLEVSTSA